MKWEEYKNWNFPRSGKNILFWESNCNHIRTGLVDKDGDVQYHEGGIANNLTYWMYEDDFPKPGELCSHIFGIHFPSQKKVMEVSFSLKDKE